MGKVTEKEEKVKMPGIGHLSGNRLQRQKIFGQKGKSVEPVLKMVNLYFNIIKIHCDIFLGGSVKNMGEK
jgi:hypothetical protein